jgi:hypothetical protein
MPGSAANLEGAAAADPTGASPLAHLEDLKSEP